MSAQTLQAGGIKFTLPAYLKPFRAAANLGLPAGRSAALNFAPKKTENSASALSEKLRVRAGNGLLWIMLLLPVVLVLAACHSKTKANAPEVRPVRTVVAAKREAGETTVLLISGKPLGFVAILGILTLIGMIARNAVILIEQIETERKEGREAWNAVIEATLSRFRPIMLTAISTVLGLIPIAPTIF